MDQKNLSSHRSCCISHEFYKSASKNPNKIAVIHSSRRHSTKSTTEIDHFIETSPSHDHHPVYKDDVCFTYSEILEAVDSLSRRLRFILDGGADPYLIRPSTGSTPIDQSTNTPRIVGIYMAPSVEYIISILSILRCGEAFMPLDPSWPKERVLSVVSSSTSKLILCGSTSFDENYSHQINKYRFLVDNVSCPVLVISMKTNLNNYFSSHSLLYPCENKTLRSFCYLMYTSGSTGKPKGVCGTEQGLLNRFVWMQDMCPLCGEETLLFKTSIGFIDHLQEILGALLTTCTLVIPPFSVLKENILSITEYLQDYSINRLVAIPSLMRMLLPSLQSSYSTTIQTSLKLLILSGEILHLSLWSSLIKLLPNTTILNLYGSTEVIVHILTVENFHLFWRLSDFAKQLPSGDLVFVGRNDRIVKVNGNRIALEEIEDTLRLHNDVDDAVVIFKRVGEVAYIEAYVVVKHGRSLSCCIRGWMFEKLPLAMIPRRFLFVDSIPISSSSGKVDYGLLESLRCSVSDICSEMDEILDSNRLQTIKEAFCDALLVEKVNNNDDFFDLGGDSISAAHASHKLGINMKLLYSFPSPLNLLMALMDPNNHPLPIVSNDTHLKTKKLHTRLSNELDESSSNNHPPHKVLKMDYDHWDSISNHMCFCAITRCNKVMFGEKYDNINTLFQANLVREEGVFLYIGSHSRKFICVKASSGVIQWEVELEGRVECSATILGDFSQVVVGCYKGNIYFLNSMNGSITWTFHTGGEVKSQPVLDKQRHLVWCGSYDHNLYALDYQTHSCVYNLNCGGSIYGSPVINEVDETLYFASTNGSMTALSLKAIPFNVLWVQDMGAPIFGSLSINHNNRNVICCLVNGHVVAVDANGSIIWRGIAGGPIFGGPSISHVLHNQVVICSRDGSVYSFGLEKGNLLWKHDLGDPIVSSAYVDENLGLKSDYSHVKEDRLICVCTSSGSIVVLRIKLDCNEVEDFGRLDIDGDIFSSPVFICGKIFVGCRDDYVYCLEIEG
ncbi:unnamed protein product [Lactuca virosa]|uniref:4-coumarate--CoA ligase n=1 Tax=Lactuca virosa TaxID=75947 RepID=A0AAU9NT64_9ASTR|nr:unnamed protein product [Lactuca virosa]